MKALHCFNIVSRLFSPSSLLAFFQVYICACPLNHTAFIAQIQFSRKTRESWRQIFFAEIKALDCSNIISILFYLSCINSTGFYFHACPVSNKAFISQTQFSRKKQKKLEKKFFVEIKALHCLNIVSNLFSPSSLLALFQRVYIYVL